MLSERRNQASALRLVGRASNEIHASQFLRQFDKAETEQAKAPIEPPAKSGNEKRYWDTARAKSVC
jgi:hypothetical protein